MRLIELEPRFIRYDEREEMSDMVAGDPLTWHERGKPIETRLVKRQYLPMVQTLAEAQGIWMLCPLCFARNGGPIGTHICTATFAGRGVPDHLGTHNDQKQPVRWNVSGSGFADLTLAPSIQLLGGCNWHGFITAGAVITC